MLLDRLGLLSVNLTDLETIAAAMLELANNAKAT